MTVVQFTKAEPLIWVCNCGCSTFRLQSDGMTECASCENTSSDGGEWRKELPEPSGEPKEILPATKVIAVADSGVALRSVLSTATVDETAAVVVISTNGRVRTWGGIDTADRAEWLDGRLADAKELLMTCVSKG